MNEGGRKKVGILGGTFNPIHIGHLILAEHAYNEFELDRVLIMPTGASYQKSNLTVLPAEVRLEMARLAVGSSEHLVADDTEVKRGGNTYTYETLEYLNSLHPDTRYFFIIGEDSLYNMETWYRHERIFKACTVLVAFRGHGGSDRIWGAVDYYEEKYAADIEVLNMPEIDISSSRIRELIESGRSFRYMVPDAVYDFIRERGLFARGN